MSPLYFQTNCPIYFDTDRTGTEIEFLFFIAAITTIAAIVAMISGLIVGASVWRETW